MDYNQFKIKEYQYWDLFLDQNQYLYVGRCYAWAKRVEADMVTDMNQEEREELFEEIIPTWKKAVESLYGAIRPNVAILGNLTPHLHAHLIPRFQTPKTIHGIEFIDPNPKGNYAPYPKKELPLEIVLKIKEEIQSKL